MQCKCGCGEQPKTGNVYVLGHSGGRRLKVLEDAPPPIRDKTTGCLLYQGPINLKTGYGFVGKRYAHRLAYEKAFGPIPEGLTIDHVYARGCRNHNCIEPMHLEAVTAAENTRRAARSRTPPRFCKSGHAMTGANVKIVPYSVSKRRLRGLTNYRSCLTCARRRGRLWASTHPSS